MDDLQRSISTSTSGDIKHINMIATTAPPTRLPNPPTLIEYRNLRFLIMDAPTDANLPIYLKELLKNNVTDVVRVCEPTYNKRTLEEANIHVHDWLFPDGEGPPDAIVDSWLRLVESLNGDVSIACHCVAGLGRAPVLVAIALIEHGMSPLDAVTFIRERRRGAINSKQLKFLEAYSPRRTRPFSRCRIA